jgi:hypothetical protein
MSEIDKWIERIKNDKNCLVRESLSFPTLPPNLCLPKDLEFFYTHCGGILLFPASEYPMEIVDPAGFVRANPIIAGIAGEEDRSHDWFILGKCGTQYITIDLNSQRLGRCYDSFWETHGLVGETPVIASNFTSLLQSLYENKGDYWYWLQEDFQSLGDAYD